MGQVLRRAIGRVRNSSAPELSAHQIKNAERRLPVVPSKKSDALPNIQDRLDISEPDILSETKNDSALLEERDPGYDALLGKMVGKITSKPGGKLEMGEAFIVEKYKRPLPKLRSSKTEAGHDEQRNLPAGTLNVAQLQEIILLHQGKFEGHQGPMDTHDIAKKFSIDATQVEKILQFVSFPPEDATKKAKNGQ